MAEPYTPTKYEVLEAWVAHTFHDQPTAYDLVEAGESFNRWLAQERREALSGYVRKPSRDEIADEVSGIQVGSGYYATVIGRDAALEAADAILALLERTDR